MTPVMTKNLTIIDENLENVSRPEEDNDEQGYETNVYTPNQSYNQLYSNQGGYSPW